jgi:hypothetical protein
LVFSRTVSCSDVDRALEILTQLNGRYGAGMAALYTRLH